MSQDEDVELIMHNYRKVSDLLSGKVTVGEIRSFMIADLVSQTEAEFRMFFTIVELIKHLKEKETHA